MYSTIKGRYSEEDIEKYMEILRSCQQGGFGGRHSPHCCENPCFTILNGYRFCEKCCVTSGHVLGYFDLKDCDRLYFRKKSIYQRKYYYEKKIKQIPNLTQDQKDELYQKLMKIDEGVMKQVNKDFKRKRMINIFYIIDKFLEEMGLNTININISSQTRDYYDRWWQSYLKALPS